MFWALAGGNTDMRTFGLDDCHVCGSTSRPSLSFSEMLQLLQLGLHKYGLLAWNAARNAGFVLLNGRLEAKC